MSDVTPSGPLPDPDGDDDLSPTARRLRDALAARAADARPADRLEEIRMSSRANRRRSRAWVAVAGAAVAVVVGGGAFALSQRGGDDAVTTVAASTSPSPSASSATTTAGPSPSSGATSGPATAATTQPVATGDTTTTGASSGTLPSGAGTVPVYWLGGQPAKLFREYVEAGGGQDDATNALRAMLAGKASDPDYSSPWSPDPSATVSASDGRLVVDLAASAASAASGTTADASTAVQQLVYTVTAAAGSNQPVEIRVDGKAQPTLFGSAVAQTVSRAPQADVQAPAWITAVTPGTGSVRVEGVGTAFEGTLLYTITDAAGAEVARNAVQAGANGTFGDFSFTAQVPAGTYTVAVFAPDESGGEGTPQVGDTKVVTVR
ncbi:Gmad2 immunoglobulin-like domain-containing protein [Kineococcus rhizosphaerae]|uniref:Sporulation and spore germination protein n=1 Tax=Kineococcus rhizosphaerae TaxID=559628 RepID=A0A2T0R7Y7_9ACTN|nr:Gmad2 immunoglobulin-like domain-containing protein [Kineococcus rhizosphaerae]PRY17268.1 sporulation and spore germination protein [Kineococcus rhizosphaerae]